MIFSPDTLVRLFPLLIAIPNIAFFFTEHYELMIKLTDIFLPLGIYYIIMSLSAKVGRTVLYCFPFIFFAAFQIVLIYLYGESIIAIDMYLNIMTTNMSEVSELLSNLLIAIITVVVIYIPSIAWAIYLIVKHRKASKNVLHTARYIGISLTFIGIILMIISYATIPSYSIRKNIFPVNVIANMVEAVNRAIDTNRYHITSADYSFSAVNTHKKDLREVYVLVVGETSRADNWQLFGYDRATNPRLSQRNDLIKYPKTLSESNTTHKSVPMLLSPLDSSNFGDSIYYVKGICDAFNEVGFNTAYFSNQSRNHSFIDFFAFQAQTTEFMRDKHPGSLDDSLVSHLREFIDRSPADKLFIILHCYGSHFNYRERYDEASRIFTPDLASEASSENRTQLVNAYDNTIVFTDSLIDDIISYIDDLGIPASVIYTSDHGEDIFDDSRGRFLHASPTTTFNQVHVPLLIWFSDRYRELFPDIAATAEQNSDMNVSSSRSIFPTVLTIAGIQSHTVDSTADLTSNHYIAPKRIYLNDYNENVSLRQAGFRDFDYSNANKCNISTE